MADARDVIREAIDEIAGSADWDDWPDLLLAALNAAGLAVVPVEPLRKVARGDCSVFSSDPEESPSWDPKP